MTDASVQIEPLSGIPRVSPGDDVARLLIEAIERRGLQPRAQDVVVVTQKIVSKAQNRYVELDGVTPSERARELSEKTGKDARLVEIILSESVDVLRIVRGVLIVETRHGLIMANAGVDQSNLSHEDHGRRVLLLPVDPDKDAAEIRRSLETRFGVPLGIVISDSIGRPWRLGTVGFAIGVSGMPSLWDRRGEPDLSGRPLEITETGFADAIAAAAVLVMGEAAEGVPAVLVRGLSWSAPGRNARGLLRSKKEDLFR